VLRPACLGKRDKLNREDDTRALLRQIYETEIDLVPNLQTNTLTLRLHHLTQAAHDQAVRHLCQELNATETIFPGTDLKLVYKLLIPSSPGIFAPITGWKWVGRSVGQADATSSPNFQNLRGLSTIKHGN
jgi:hypothetical protein